MNKINLSSFSKTIFTTNLWLVLLILSTTQINAQIDNSLIGKWTGIVNQPGFGSYETEMTIESLIIDETSGETEYPSLACGGTNVFLDNIDSLHVFSETIIFGGNCIDGRIELYKLSSDTIQWNWYYNGGDILGTFGQLVRDQTIGLDQKEENLSPFNLSEISPNPFVDFTQFTLELERNEDVAISLIDLNGKEVMSIYKGKLLPFQKHHFSINREDLANGFYVLSVRGASFKFMKKVFATN